jgi:hypothetical protein
VPHRCIQTGGRKKKAFVYEPTLKPFTNIFTYHDKVLGLYIEIYMGTYLKIIFIYDIYIKEGT